MMMRFHRTILVILAVAGLAYGCSTPETEESIIRKTRNDSNNAIVNRDTAALARCWTADYHIISSRNSEVSGRRNNQLVMNKEFSAGKLFIRTPKEITIFKQWNMASEYGTWVGTWQGTTEPIEVSGNYFAKWHCINGHWLIRAEIFVPLHCAGNSFCNQQPF